MARFIRFPGGGAAYAPEHFTFDGVSGTFLSTPDVNMLDADTAHIQQSKGNWTNVLNIISSALSSDVPMFGDNSLKVTADGGGTCIVRTGTGLNGTVAVSSSTAYALSFVSQAATTSRTVVVAVTEWDIGGGYVTDTVVASGANATGVVTTVGGTFTTQATTRFISFRVDINNPVASEVHYFGRFLIDVGSDATFVPSLRIVGDIEMESKASSPSSANQTLMATWVGSGSDGYQFGANLSGNLLARHGNGSVDRFASGSNALTPGVFQTVKGGFDAAGNWSFDIDGVSETVGPTTPGAASPSGGLAVGSNAGGAINLFTGDISSAVVRDGIGGPAVASFNPDDYTGGAGAIPDGTTFIDSVTGRVWTANGNIVNVPVEFGNSIATEGLTIPTPRFIVKNPPAMPDIIDGDRWIIGNQWAGDGFTAQMHDGTDATGAIVAEFDAEDIGL